LAGTVGVVVTQSWKVAAVPTGAVPVDSYIRTK
jgi:hypothetical protein